MDLEANTRQVTLLGVGATSPFFSDDFWELSKGSRASVPL